MSECDYGDHPVSVVVRSSSSFLSGPRSSASHSSREVKISLRQRQRVRERHLNIAVVRVTFYTQRDEPLIASFSSTATITNMNPGRTQEMMMSAYKKFVLVLVVVVKS